jgi:hypothetical protein
MPKNHSQALAMREDVQPRISDISPEIPVTDREPGPLTESGSREEEIRQRAYQKYLERGRQDGHAEDDWLSAEEEIGARRG